MKKMLRNQKGFSLVGVTYSYCNNGCFSSTGVQYVCGYTRK